MGSRVHPGRSRPRFLVVLLVVTLLLSLSVVISPPAFAAGTWTYASSDKLTVLIDWTTDNGQNAQYEVFTLTVPVVSASCGPGNAGQVGQPDGNPDQFECHGTEQGTATAKTKSVMPCSDSIQNKDSFDGATYVAQSNIGPSPDNCGAPPPEAACKVNGKGWFEPVQGVYQDDNPLSDPTFPDKPTKQIEEVESSGNALDTYEAQLDMIKNRDTVLFGVNRAVGEEPKDGPPNSRHAIVVKGTTNCPMVDAKMKFTLVQGAAETPIFTSKILGKAPNACATTAGSKMVPFDLTLPDPKGIPPTKTFTFPMDGDYLIRDEVIDGQGADLCLFVDVTGQVVTTRGPTTFFIPVSLGTAPAALAGEVKEMAQNSGAEIPDFMPIPPRSMVTPYRADPFNIGSYVGQAQKDWQAWATGLPIKNPALTKDAARLEAVNKLFTGIAEVSTVDRVAVVFDNTSFNTVMAPYNVNTLAGDAVSNKTVVLHRQSPITSVAHELIHTLPYLWSSAQMQTECGFNFHGGGRRSPIAHAFQITHRGNNAAANRRFRDPAYGIMQSFGFEKEHGSRWMDQCTYWHLAKVLQAVPDPAVTLVQGRIGQTGSESIGQLFPAYQLDAGTPDLTTTGTGSWSIVVKDANGTTLATYPFNPVWHLPDMNRNEPFRSFAYKIPTDPDAASVSLVGPSGVLDTKTVSANAPSVSITSPAEGSTVTPVKGKVQVAWTGTDADDDPLVYSVAISDDGGQTFYAVSFDQTGTSLNVRVPLSGSTSHSFEIRVMASDGMRTTTSVAHFSTPSG